MGRWTAVEGHSTALEGHSTGHLTLDGIGGVEKLKK